MGLTLEHFFPLKKDHKDFPKLEEFKKTVLKDKDIDFVLFYNSRNIRRKSTADTILAYRIFCDSIGKDKAKKCAFILHTDPKDQHGTDLRAVREAFCDPSYVNVFFSSDKIPTAQLNLLYNIADATILLSSNEGWGLGLTESLMTATPIIANVTGGMQDQMRFTKDGKWVDHRGQSDHRGTIKEHGEWAFPVYPTSRSIAGSLPTPYIFDDKCTPEDAAIAIEKVYNLTEEERLRVGEKGYEWVTGDEANMTATKMSNRVIEVLDEGFDKYIPRELFNFHKIEDRPANYIEHKLTGY